MIKKYFYGMLAFFVVAVLSVGLVSCKDDETQNPQNPSGPSVSDPSTFSVVGTWKCEWNDGGVPGYSKVTLNSNGTGVYGEYFYEGGKLHIDEEEYFNYKVLGRETCETGNLLITLQCSFGDEKEVWEIEVISSNKVKFDGEVFVRQ